MEDYFIKQIQVISTTRPNEFKILSTRYHAHCATHGDITKRGLGYWSAFSKAKTHQIDAHPRANRKFNRY